MPWLEINPTQPREGDTVTITLTPDYFAKVPDSILLESEVERVSLPVRAGVAQIHLVRTGHYTLRADDHRFSFELLGRQAVPIQNELLLTMGLVLFGLGGLVRWTQRRKAGSTSPSGGS